MKLFLCSRTLLKRNTFIFQNLICQVAKMSSSNSTVYVKQFEQEDTMKITFMYKYLDLPSQNFTFQRSKTELLKSALSRIKSKIQLAVLQKNSKKRKKKFNSDIEVELPPLNIMLQKNGITVHDEIENRQAWTSDAEMIIGELSYKICVNPPSISHISLPRCILTNFPVYPKVSFDFCSQNDCTFHWYRNTIKCTDTILENSQNSVKSSDYKWDLISNEFIHNVQEADVGHKLLVSCIPHSDGRTGMEVSAMSPNCVVLGPDHCPFEDRHNFTKELTQSECFRCVSYNILADLYADSDTARNHLFPYCPASMLAVDYRKALYLKEIAGYNADIICLQEVDKQIFYDDLVPFLSRTGLTGVFNTKGGQIPEGLACFFRESKFKLIESHSIFLSEAIKTEPVLQHLYSTVNQNEKLSERFFNRTTALQVTLLQSIEIPNKRVLVGNTHLYFHPESDNIRLIQGACCLIYLEHWLQKYQQDTSSQISLIFAGDFNSSPDCGIYKLSTEGFVPRDCIDWESNNEEKVGGVELRLSLPLNSACGTPQYTNFTRGFVGCLDYIFYDKVSLEVSEVVPLPSHEQVTEHIALPNKVFPSDHIALVCTLRWK